jgi:hypothetical protein
MGVGGQRYTPAALPPGVTLYPLYKRLGGPQGRYEQVRNIWPPPGFDYRTIEPVTSGFTDHTIPTHKLQTGTTKNAEFQTLNRESGMILSYTNPEFACRLCKTL